MPIPFLLAGVAVIAWLLGTGEDNPAVLYLPALLLGVGLLVGG